jgi:hypothetical protein
VYGLQRCQIMEQSGAAEPGAMGHVLPPPHFFKSGKSALFQGPVKSAHLKNEKSSSWMNAFFCWKESALFAVLKTLL